MASKKPKMTGLFDRTEPQPGEAPQEKKRRKPIGLYLRNETLAVVQEIAAKEDIPIHGLLVYAITSWLKLYRAGKVKIEKQQTTTLNLDL